MAIFLQVRDRIEKPSPFSVPSAPFRQETRPGENFSVVSPTPKGETAIVFKFSMTAFLYWWSDLDIVIFLYRVHLFLGPTQNGYWTRAGLARLPRHGKHIERPKWQCPQRCCRYKLLTIDHSVFCHYFTIIWIPIWESNREGKNRLDMLTAFSSETNYGHYDLMLNPHCN